MADTKFGRLFLKIKFGQSFKVGDAEITVSRTSNSTAKIMICAPNEVKVVGGRKQSVLRVVKSDQNVDDTDQI